MERARGVDPPGEQREQALLALAARLGHRFSDPSLLERALTHASRANEEPCAGLRDNEPLEFLGDAILGFLVAELLHERDPDGPEGAKTRARARLVSASNLARHARALGLPELLALGRGVAVAATSRVWADAFEAVLAALYLDGGLEAARRLVAERLEPDLTESGAVADYKSTLQELLQARHEALPTYPVVTDEQRGPRRHFRVRCVVKGVALAEGEGYSKKTAEQEAARGALAALSARRG